MAAKGKTTGRTKGKAATAPAKGRRSKTVAKGKPKAKGAASDAGEAGARRRAPSKGRRYAVIAVSAGLAIIIGAFLVWSEWSPRFASAPEPEQRLASVPGQAPMSLPSQSVVPAPTKKAEDLLARIDVLEAKLDRVERTIAGAERRIAEDAGKRAAERSAAAAVLARRLKTVEGGIVTAAGIAGRIDALEKDLHALSRAAPGGPSASLGVALLLGAVELRDALSRGAPFAAEVAALERAFAGDQRIMAALASLSKWAGLGVASHDDLRRRLEELAPRLLRAAKRPPGGGWIEETWARISALVVIRPTGGDVAGDAPGAVLARAEAKLALGDLESAVAEVERLRGPAAAAAGDWLAAASARLGAKKAIAALSARAADLLGGAPLSSTGAPGAAGGEGEAPPASKPGSPGR